jgi:hypothetical protein
MSLTYAAFTVQVANFLVIPLGDPNLNTALPSIIDDAEQRAYRDLDLLNTIYRDTSVAFTAGNRNYTETASVQGNGPFLVTQELNVITPAGQTNPELGTRNALLPATKEMLDFLYPNSTGSGVPTYYAPINQNTFIVGPWPDQAYTVEAVGTVRPAPLSASNTTTLLSVYFPDLFLAAALACGYGYLKDYGAASDDPQSGISWEKKYTGQLKSAIVEEGRKKFQAQGWGNQSTSPEATPPRT